MMYNVLWIDDEFELQKDFIGAAEQDGIDIYPYGSHEEGIKALESKLDFFHAVILDAKVKNKRTDVVTGLAGLTASRDRLIELNNRQYLPFFIFTGQPDYVDHNFFKETFGKYYIKAKDNDQLFADLKEQVENKTEYKIRKQFAPAFEICMDNYIGRDAGNTLLAALKLSEEARPSDTKEAFNSLRKLVELLFSKLNKIGIIPDEIFNSSQWLNPSSLFLSGQHKNYKIQEGVIHPTITFLLRQILQASQDASHSVSEKLNLRIDDFILENQTPYLYRSTLNQLLDVLVWFKKFIDQHPDAATNKGLWSCIWIRGRVIKVADNGWGTFKIDNTDTTVSIPPHKISEHELKENDLIEILTEPSPDKKKTFIKEIKTSK